MKIVHLCLSAFYIDNYSYQENMLSKYHVKQGYEVTVIASLFTYSEKGKGMYLPRPSEYVNNDGVKIVRLNFKRPFYKINKILRRYKGFLIKLEDEKPDVIFSHNVSTADMATLKKYMVMHPHVKLFADNHADYINSGKNVFSRYVLHPFIWRYYAKMIEPYVSKFYGVTPMRCRFLSEMYKISQDKIVFLPMGVDDESIPNNRFEVKKTIRDELGIPQDATVIFTGGKIDRLKNTHVLADAFTVLDIENIHLIICGVLTPEMVPLNEIFDANERIHYLGWCDAARVINCMVASDIACFPGTHSTLWEQSVGIGLPSVFKRWNEMEHVNVNDNCIFVKGEDVDELTNAIRLIISNYKKYQIAAEVASQQFLYSNISKKAIGL